MADPFRSTARRHIDAQLATASIRDVETPPDGWIQTIREALGMSAADLASRMGVTRAAVRQLEDSERRGGAKLETLQRAAEAMGTRLHYAFVPERSLTELVEQRARELAEAELAPTNHSMALELQRPDSTLDETVVHERARELVDSRRLWAVDR